MAKKKTRKRKKSSKFSARKHPRYKTGARKGQFMAKGGKKKATKRPAKKSAKRSAPKKAKSSKKPKGTILASAAKLRSAGINIPDKKLAFFDGDKNLRVANRLGGGKKGKRKHCRTVCKS